MPLEAVEACPGILPDREQHVHRQAGVVDDPDKLGREPAQPLPLLLAGVVLEVLLELVEDKQKRPRLPAPGPQRLRQRPRRRRKRPRGLRLQLRPRRLLQPHQRLLPPGAKKTDRKPTLRRRLGAQLPQHARLAALPDPTGPIKIVGPGSPRIRRNDRDSLDRPKKLASPRHRGPTPHKGHPHAAHHPASNPEPISPATPPQHP